MHHTWFPDFMSDLAEQMSEKYGTSDISIFDDIEVTEYGLVRLDAASTARDYFDGKIPPSELISDWSDICAQSTADAREYACIY